jgi:hypothetical protein
LKNLKKTDYLCEIHKINYILEIFYIKSPLKYKDGTKKMEAHRWNQKPILNSIIDILIKNKGEILDKRLEELLRKEFPFINSLSLEEIFMKLESMGIINVFRVSKNKKMIVLNKNSQAIKEELFSESV